MTLVDDIATLYARGDLTPIQKSRLAAAARANGVHSALVASLPRTFTAGQWSVTVTSVQLAAGQVAIWCSAMKGGVTIPLDLPIVIQNPSLLIADPTGDVMRPGAPAHGPFPATPDRVFRFAPLLAIGQLLVQHIRRLAP